MDYPTLYNYHIERIDQLLKPLRWEEDSPGDWGGIKGCLFTCIIAQVFMTQEIWYNTFLDFPLWEENWLLHIQNYKEKSKVNLLMSYIDK